MDFHLTSTGEIRTIKITAELLLLAGAVTVYLF